MVIYSTTRDKPVLGEIVKMGLCQMLTKGHSMHNGKKLLQLRRSGIPVSSPHLALPIFPDSPPSPIDFSAVQGFLLIFTGNYTTFDGVAK